MFLLALGNGQILLYYPNAILIVYDEQDVLTIMAKANRLKMITQDNNKNRIRRQELLLPGDSEYKNIEDSH